MPARTDTERNHSLEFLFSRIDYERTANIPYDRWEFHLDRMRDLLARLENPQQQLKIIHVAGTKGKGSTSAMLSAALSASGYRTGLFTSPHLDRLEERIAIDGQPCSPQDIAALINRIRPFVEQMDAEGARRSPPQPGPTYFEILTAMAFLHFAAAEVDLAVVEVGLGGRLDSTNVCRPLVSVITSISFDHTQELGHTLAAIATEKAGIIKPGVPIVSGVIEEEPRGVIKQIAHERGCRIVQLGIDFRFEYHPPRNFDDPASPNRASIDFESSVDGRRQLLQNINLGLLGRHQAANAAVALATLNELRAQGLPIPETDLRRGLAEINWPARVEIVSRRPAIVIDAAHNVASVQSLLDTLQESFQSSRRLLIFGTTRDKDIRGMLQLLLPRFETVILTRYLNNPRAAEIAELEALTAELADIPRFVAPDPATAWKFASELITPEHLVCVTGSFYLAAEMRAEIVRALPLAVCSQPPAMPCLP